jgi:hypothetical protein
MGSAIIVVLGDLVQADRHRGPGALPVTPARTPRGRRGGVRSALCS